MKRCGTCKQVLDERNFSRQVGRQDGLASGCKRCHKQALERRRKEKANSRNALTDLLARWKPVDENEIEA